MKKFKYAIIGEGEIRLTDKEPISFSPCYELVVEDVRLTSKFLEGNERVYTFTENTQGYNPDKVHPSERRSYKTLFRKKLVHYHTTGWIRLNEMKPVKYWLQCYHIKEE